MPENRPALRVLDLFSGICIGGFSLGLERTGGFETIAFCEINPYCRQVLARHWPGVPCYDDVRKLTAERLRADGIGPVDLVCGGFPCQDLSLAGAGAGLAGERSGLWRELARLIGELRPRFALLENVAGLLNRGLGQVLGDLAEIGFDAEWHCIPAAAVGAPHRRDRIWIVAYPNGGGREVFRIQEYSGVESAPRRELDGLGEGRRRAGTDVADAERGGCARSGWQPAADPRPDPARPAAESILCGADAVADPGQPRLPVPERQIVCGAGWWQEGRAAAQHSGWAIEPDVGRMVARFSDGMDGGRLDGSPKSGGTGEILQALRDPVSAQNVRWPARGFGGLQEAEILLAQMCQYQGKTRPLGNVSLACEETSEIVVRGVWFDGNAACPSCRRLATEQRAREHPDLVRLLSQLLACDCRSTWLDPTGTPSRTSRVDRLTALGNAVVPQIPELIGRAILAAGG